MKPFNPLEYPSGLAFPERLSRSAWTEHVPFAMTLVEMLRPRVLVELGTYYGVSYCAFCQAVARLGLATRCYAVDTWQGDEHAGQTGPEVLDDLRRHHDGRYRGFSRLIVGTFDDAAGHFSDGSIDLLHIDGYHTYDAVAHDFATWRPKLSERGVALFHDVNVRQGDFGVWQFWEEVKRQYPAFEFLHHHGLGVLAVGPQVPEPLRPLLEASEDEAARIREYFFQLGERVLQRWELGEQVRELRAELGAQQDRHAQEVAVWLGQLADYQANLTDVERRRQELEKDLYARLRQAESDLAQCRAQVDEQLRQLRDCREVMAVQERDLRAQHRELTENQAAVRAYAAANAELTALARSLEAEIRSFKGSLTWRCGHALAELARRLAPAGTRRRQVLLLGRRGLSTLARLAVRPVGVLAPRREETPGTARRAA